MGWDTWANALEKSGILRISPETYTSAEVAHYSVNVPSFSEDDTESSPESDMRFLRICI